MITTTRIPDGFSDWTGLLALIRTAFAYMDDVIDPPSSAHRLTPESLAEKARGEICYLALEDGVPVGCIFLKPEAPDCLYVGKLAVLPRLQGKGVGRRLLQTAEDEARRRNLSRLRLETRIELMANHATFAAWGFAKTADRSHPGFDRITFIEMQKVLPTAAEQRQPEAVSG
ncbi:GNAT family N-acetyltransferase [Rhizobium sp. CSW-27]|uniref:GNAT family N-acetyltransferase n=1 Tax=Rhizobium sp. CSW-27 TaxID=2839985 RepID=UPI001C01EDD1|nr:GNAT family N-acetyltransferase [Rhizobium sp. CSW-27]MBT9371528.1 GNAT family N-acetyltransferase [Rhizobium sp. CSW-27]